MNTCTVILSISQDDRGQERMTADVEQLVHEVTDLTGSPAPEVFDQNAPVLRTDVVSGDGFYLVGLIGGKEVGKSALVNALAGQIISGSPRRTGRARNRCWRTRISRRRSAVTELLRREVPGKFRVIMHDLPHLARQVLLDLPEFDSHYADHVEGHAGGMLRHNAVPGVDPVDQRSTPTCSRAAPPRRRRGGERSGELRLRAQQARSGHRPMGATAACAGAGATTSRGASRKDLVACRPPPNVYMISALHPDRYDLPTLRELLAQQKSTEIVRQSLDLAAGSARGRCCRGWTRRTSPPARND
jgi:hypothetical protein